MRLLRKRSANTLNESKLTVSLWDRHPPFPGVIHFENPHQLSSRTFRFDLSRSESGAWFENHRDEREYTSEALADELLKWLMERGERKK